MVGRTLHMIFWKEPNERAAAIQAVIDRSLIKGEAYLQQAFSDIDADHIEPYERFFNLHIFRQESEGTLRWLPMIYRKLRQKKNTFEPVLRSMKPGLSRLRTIARNGANQPHSDDFSDVYFVSSEGEKIYAHSKVLLNVDVVKNLVSQKRERGEKSSSLDREGQQFKSDEIHLGNRQFKSDAIHLFLDLVYGNCDLDELSEAHDLDVMYDIANALEYESLRDAVFRRTKVKLDALASEIRARSSHSR
jgi:hypothetical protein